MQLNAPTIVKPLPRNQYHPQQQQQQYGYSYQVPQGHQWGYRPNQNNYPQQQQNRYQGYPPPIQYGYPVPNQYGCLPPQYGYPNAQHYVSVPYHGAGVQLTYPPNYNQPPPQQNQYYHPQHISRII